MNTLKPLFLGPEDIYMTPEGAVTRTDDGGMEFNGAFGRMRVPEEVVARAARLVKFGRNRFEYMAAWCDRKLAQEYGQAV